MRLNEVYEAKPELDLNLPMISKLTAEPLSYPNGTIPIILLLLHVFIFKSK